MHCPCLQLPLPLLHYYCPLALKKKRLALGMTQQDVAEKATISLSSYQKYESGNRNIMTASFEIVCRVIIALGMDPTSFYWENAD